MCIRDRYQRRVHGRVSPKKGFWRSSQLSLYFIRCPIKVSCLEGDVQDPLGKCAPGYRGRLCFECKPLTYGKLSSGGCVSCANPKITNIIWEILRRTVQIYLLFMSVSNQRKKNYKIAHGADVAKMSRAGILLKIMTSFVQANTIIFSIPYVMQRSANQRRKSFLTSLIRRYIYDDSELSGFSWDCILSKLGLRHQFESLSFSLFGYENISFDAPLSESVKILLITGFFLGFFSMLIIAKAKFKFKNETKCDLLCAILVVLYFYTAPIQRATINMFNCINISQSPNLPERYLHSNYQVACSDSRYLKYLWMIPIPTAIIILTFLPLMVFIKIRNIHKRHQEDEINNILVFGFIYSGYKREVYFWEFFILFRKLILILMIIALCEMPQGFLSLVVLSIIAVSYQLQRRYLPYLSEDLNKIEGLSLMCSAVIVFSTAMYNAYKEGFDPIYLDQVLVISMTLTIISLFVFISKWSVLFIPELIMKLWEGKGIYKIPGFIYKCFIKILGKKLPEKARLYLMQPNHVVSTLPGDEKKTEIELADPQNGDSHTRSSKEDPKGQPTETPRST
eukprot:TRINITY_DN9546_c0_g1_i4.p1 TRINITY_DN9546_c0_g1~~TRINITY_DN9546_c0_g1_i4.p1  ORF type:complete len:565 (+),score=53.96 TRINITY_DN9546_c0_g1_i4:66-1760(+)